MTEKIHPEKMSKKSTSRIYMSIFYIFFDMFLRFVETIDKSPHQFLE